MSYSAQRVENIFDAICRKKCGDSSEERKINGCSVFMKNMRSKKWDSGRLCSEVKKYLKNNLN